MGRGCREKSFHWMEHNDCFHVASGSQQSQGTPNRQYLQSAKLLSKKFSVLFQCILNKLEKHWDNFFDCNFGQMLLQNGLTELYIFFMTRSTTFFSSTVFIIFRLLFFLIRRQSTESTLNELRSKLGTSLKMCYVSEMFFLELGPNLQNNCFNKLPIYAKQKLVKYSPSGILSL